HCPWATGASTPLPSPPALRAAQSPARRAAKNLLQDRLVKLVPVVQIVQVHCARVNRALVPDAVGAQNTFALPVLADVTHNRGVVLIDRCLVQAHSGLLLNPGFELAVGGLALGDELPDGIRV